MPDQSRFEKTIENIRTGGLPRPTADRVRDLAAGNGLPCNGCGAGVEVSEDCVHVTIAGVLRLRFHEECYSAWVGYTA